MHPSAPPGPDITPECGLERRVLPRIPAHGGSLQWFRPHPVLPLLLSLSPSLALGSVFLSASVSFSMPSSQQLPQSLSVSASGFLFFCISVCCSLPLLLTLPESL